MPTISEFFGICIRMYYEDHHPAHFHAIYGEYEAQICIDTMTLMNGALPKRALSLVVEWAESHREELLRDWVLAERHEPLERIKPLE